MEPNAEEPFIQQLLSQMTLQEKLGQLSQVAPNPDPEMLRQGQIGSIISAPGALAGQSLSESGDADTTNRLQQLALEARLKIPVIFGRDVIHGFRTIFPIPLGQAATFNPELAGQAAATAADEAATSGIKWTFAPMLDIARDPRWGRVAEGNGEDPYLASRMAEALVRGYQGEDMSAADKLVACAKHFAGYGLSEGGRDYESGEVSDPTLRDVYLPPFRAAVRAGVGTFMSAFIDLNGVPATANRYLLNDILREEWQFDGFVVSDWESIRELVPHGIAEDEAHAARLALQAGVDMDMISGAYRSTLAESVQEGKLNPALVDQAVLRILRIKQRAGLFDHPFTDPTRAQYRVLTPQSRDLARRVARQSMVLLKNKDGLLPLSGFRRILVAGPFVHARSELFGTWTLDGRAQDVTPVDEALRAAAPQGVELWFTELPDLALHMAHSADAVLLLMGEHPARSGENNNVSELSLPAGQTEFIESMAALGKPLTLVVFAGRPLALARETRVADALLYAWHPGIEGASALGDLLFGADTPSGRLPITFPRGSGQVPIYYAHKNSGRPVTADGQFRTRYLDQPDSALFPFGYGLTYTNFRYDQIRLSSETLRSELEVSAQVSNVGQKAGTEVVQLYIRDLVGSLTRPVRELKGFQRVMLDAGETRRVSFTLYEEDLAFTRADGTFGFEPGRFQVWIGPDSQSGLGAEFRI
jgi:beta-glucosidase